MAGQLQKRTASPPVTGCLPCKMCCRSAVCARGASKFVFVLQRLEIVDPASLSLIEKLCCQSANGQDMVQQHHQRQQQSTAHSETATTARTLFCLCDVMAKVAKATDLLILVDIALTQSDAPQNVVYSPSRQMSELFAFCCQSAWFTTEFCGVIATCIRRECCSSVVYFRCKQPGQARRAQSSHLAVPNAIVYKSAHVFRVLRVPRCYLLFCFPVAQLGFLMFSSCLQQTGPIFKSEYCTK